MKEDVITIRVHVDDLKISARLKKSLEDTIKHLQRIYGEITVHWGPEYSYLGMLITTYPEQKKITLSMSGYVKGCLDEFEQDNGDQVIKVVVTPATENLFKVRSEGEAVVLSKNKAAIFHSVVAKLLFLAKRGRPDILLAVSFLTTRVQLPDEDDWKS